MSDARRPAGERRPAPERPGDTVDRYVIQGEVGRGGMGIVYRARDLKLERDVAIKRPWPELALDEPARRRFLREAKVTSRLLHPNVVPIFEVLEQAGQHWLVMELVDGPDLGQLIRDRGPLSLADVLRFAEGLAGALEFAHKSGVLHRDIKPRNVLIDRQAQARLTDFGLARFYFTPGDQSGISTVSDSITAEGRIVGTLQYMSPEQVLGRPVDPRSDIFSLGVLLYEACTGEAAFAPTERGEIVDSILNREPLPISRLNYEIPEDLERIVRKCIAKRPDERYQSATELLVDLRALRRRSSEKGIADSRPPARRGNRYARRVLASLSIAAIVTVGVWIGWEKIRDEDALPLGTVRQLTSDPAWEAEAAISPDGTTVAFTAETSGSVDIWIIDVRGGEPLRLTDDDASDRSPAWMPDGSALLFVSSRGGRESIWKMARFGGSPTLVIENAIDPAPSPDGRRIAFAQQDASGGHRIAVTPLGEPGYVQVLTGAGDGLWSHRNPAWSPDGSTICYSDYKDLWLVPAAGGRARQLTTDGAGDVEPVWSPNGNRIYFTSYREGTFALWGIGLDGSAPRRLTAGSGPERGPSVSRDGSRMTYSTYLDNPDIVLLEPASGRTSRLESRRNEVGPVFSPDATRLAFVTDRWGQFSIGIQDLAEGAAVGPPRRLTDHPGSCSHPSFSPDGRWIAYHRVLEGERDIWVVSATGGGVPVRVTTDESTDIHPDWSPDGRRIAFASDRSGTSQIWTVPVVDGRPAGPAERLTFGETFDSDPAWSPDGTWIAFLGETGASAEVWVVPSDGSAAPRALTRGANGELLRWRRNGDLLVSGHWGSGPLSIRVVPLDATPPVPFDPEVDFGTAALRGDFDLTADGRLLAYVEQVATGDIWILETDAGAY